MIKEIQLKSFSNSIALEMGIKIIRHAEANGKSIAVSIDRLNHTVFRYLGNNQSEDKHDWLRRKANVSVRFEESSMAVKEALLKGGMTLAETFGLDNADYIAKGGAIPLTVENAGMVGIVTVSGLSDIEDHQIILDALENDDNAQFINQD